jgi:hypothetical protein
MTWRPAGSAQGRKMKHTHKEKWRKLVKEHFFKGTGKN